MFDTIEKAVKALQAAQKLASEALDIAAVEALIIIEAQLLGQTDELMAELTSEQQAEFKTLVSEADLANLTPEVRRQVLQLLIVSVMREDQLQANYQLTPDAIGMWVTFFVEQFLATDRPHRITDLTVGSGNLLATVNLALNQLEADVAYTGIENDDTMLTIASGVAGLLDANWDLQHTDALSVAPAADQDVVIADLPSGYYPGELDDRFTTKAAEGLTFVHHAMVEQGVSMLRPGGLGLFLVPANLFEAEQADAMLKFLQSDAVHFQGLFQFADGLFATKQGAKALLMIQRQGDAAQQANPVMLAKVPAMNQVKENRDFVLEMQGWMTANDLTNQ